MLAASALVVGIQAALVGCSGSEPSEPVRPTVTEQPVVPADFASAAPIVAADGSPAFADLADAEWIARTADATGIPERALRAYAAATITSNRENPGCGAGWNTLAGIGWVESRHGEVFGGAVGPTGLVTPEVFGVPLDGVGVAEIPDSDAGAIDGDASIDRAVGPMQMIPGTWRNWHVDPDGDGESPHDLDDAALAGVHYLCRAGGDLASEDGWRTAIFAWNRSEEYLMDVGGWANRYAEDAASGSR